ncbi:actin-like ATPase domain-containing protein [Leucogyrophana mollusca]|uniref:Actin-like ATPase domain-containing protein n=1 Tax=Leucogyrophana mollusca TaxID=85980 RepID=A0ACB8BPY2_9AGAM|nr:actin-like ATPase domain-containing protein [Leucogyrophana mollusca]
MPRGIPNAKKDDTGLRYTTLNVPLAPNPKHLGTSYLKSDSQTLWARNATRKNKLPVDESVPPPDQRRGSQVIVIHPGSRWLRIGKASDVNPISIPNVVARKHRPPVPVPPYVEGISRPRKGRVTPTPQPQNGDEYAVSIPSDDPFDVKIASITVSLRERMRFYKLRVTPNAAGIASTFNEQFKPEIIPEVNDPFRVDWIQESSEDAEALIGENALRISDPQLLNYTVRWPIHGSNFNTRDYPSVRMILDDIEAIIRTVLKDKFSIERQDYRDYSVVLVIPDVHERAYVREFVNLLLVSLGFKQICVQQESLAATYGAGISNACVVDIGAVTSSIACVDEGLVIGDSRMSLNMGGDDITEFLFVLLDRISFPYRDINLARWYDWNVMEDLKARLCTLAEGDVALNLYDFVVRKPGKPTEKYGLRAYDEIILAPMCIFEPRVIEYDRKRVGLRSISHSDVTEEIIEHAADHVTQAMIISTQHLLPPPPPPASVDILTSQPTIPVPSQGGTPPVPVEGSTKQEQQDVPLPTTADATPVPESAPPPVDLSAGTNDAPMEIVDAEGEGKVTTPVPPQSQQPAPEPLPVPTGSYPGGLAIDVCFEASKLPLDVAIFNSARASGGDEKIRKYLQAVLVIGGSALIPGMAHALESRLQAIATPLVPNMDKVQIIPPPKEVDPRVVAWKGAAVLGKMDSVLDLWLTPADWDILGMRGLKERCFYL